MNIGNKITGIKGFSMAWLGQAISVIAFATTTFGLTKWIFRQTESSTAMAIM
jgi:hypothetical protein